MFFVIPTLGGFDSPGETAGGNAYVHQKARAEAISYVSQSLDEAKRGVVDQQKLISVVFLERNMCFKNKLLSNHTKT